MKNTYVVVADASRAHMFVLRAERTSMDTSLSRLVSVFELERAERRQRPSERYSDTRPGTLHASPGGAAHGVDDHRDAQESESDRRFARHIVQEMQRVTVSEPIGTLILAASPRMLGMLRDEMEDMRGEFELHELDRDLTTLAPAMLHDYLVGQDLLPARGRAA